MKKKSIKRIVKIRSNMWSLKRKFGKKKSRSNVLRPLLWALASCFNMHIGQASFSNAVQGRSQDFWKGGHMLNGWGRFAVFISFFLNTPVRPNYFGGEGNPPEPPLGPPPTFPM